MMTLVLLAFASVRILWPVAEQNKVDRCHEKTGACKKMRVSSPIKITTWHNPAALTPKTLMQTVRQPSKELPKRNNKQWKP